MNDQRARARFGEDADDDVVVPLRDASDAELRLQEIVDRLRIGFAAGRLHHLADEPAGQLRLGFRLRHFVRQFSSDA